jgi:hypothetical protein
MTIRHFYLYVALKLVFIIIFDMIKTKHFLYNNEKSR